MTLHALLIDDDPNNLSVLSEMLSMEGITNTKIQDPVKLHDILKTVKQVDLVFLDLEMPGVDGYQVLEILRNNYRYDGPVIACTVHLAEVSTARDLGFHSFLGKPLDADRFPDQLRRILDGQPVWEMY